MLKINKQIVCCFLCLLSTAYGISLPQDAIQQKTDAQTNYVLTKEEELKFPEGQARTQYLAGHNSYTNNELDEAVDLFQKSATLCILKQNPLGEMICNYWLSKCYRRIADYSNYQKYLSLLLEQSKKLANKEYQFHAYEGFGNLYRYLGEYPLSIENYLESIKIAESTGMLREASVALNNMSLVYEYLGNIDEELKIQLRNYELLQKINNKSEMAFCLGNLSSIYQQLKQSDKAGECIKKAMKISEEKGQENMNFKERASIFRQYASWATLEKNYKLALTYYNKGFDLMKINKDKKGVSEYYGNLASVYLLMGKFVLAEEFYLKQLELSGEIHYLNGRLTACASLKELKLKLKDYKAASVYMQEYTQLKDSSASVAAKLKIALTATRFKFKSNQQEQKIIASKKALSELEQQRRKIIYCAFGIILILIFLIAFLFFRNHKRKRNN